VKEQEIINNAPEGATHVSSHNLYHKTHEDFWYYWSIKLKSWFICSCDPHIRSLADIERIVELEEIVKAVAHIGIDFGYGEYEVEQRHIDNARKLMGGTS
jgi:hypothetical protein